MGDYILKLRISGWFDAYYQPEILKQREIYQPGFRELYIDSLIADFEKYGKCCISKFNSITGDQIYFDNDPNKVL